MLSDLFFYLLQWPFLSFHQLWPKPLLNTVAPSSTIAMETRFQMVESTLVSTEHLLNNRNSGSSFACKYCCVRDRDIPHNLTSRIFERPRALVSTHSIDPFHIKMPPHLFCKVDIHHQKGPVMRNFDVLKLLNVENENKLFSFSQTKLARQG